jgi:ribose transport system permease protein
VDSDDAAVTIVRPKVTWSLGGLRYLLSLPNTNIFFLLIALLASSLFFSLSSPYFFQVRNLFNMGRAVSVNGIAAAFATIVLISGGFDLSIGVVMNAAAVAAAVLIGEVGLPLPVAFAIAIGIGMVVGLINGLLIARVGINPFITTVGTQFVVRGITFLISGKAWVISDETLLFIGQGNIPVGSVNIPVPVILMLCAMASVYLILRFTRFGKYVYAIGGNPLACRRAGIKVEPMRIYIYVLSGASAAAAGLVQAGLAGAGVPYGATNELSVIAGVILGGTALTGGTGTVQGTFLGILLVGVLKNGLTLLNVHAYYQMVVEGAMLLAAVALDCVKHRFQIVTAAEAKGGATGR